MVEQGGLSLLEIKLTKSFSTGFTMGIDICLPLGQCTGMYGPSGAGKTTLLRLLAGLDKPNLGYVAFNQVVFFDSQKKINLKPQKRNTALVFQGADLFEHMSVEQNINFAAVDPPIKELLKRFGLATMANKKPKQLSGGERQRVSMARALARRPQLLLLDEPFSALDGRSRQYLQGQLKEVQVDLALTTILVSHDISELYSLSSNLALLEQGKVVGQDKISNLISQNSISGKFKFTGKIVDIQKSDMLFTVTLDVQNQLTRILVARESAQNLSVGDYAMVSAKAFNPVLTKVGG